MTTQQPRCCFGIIHGDEARCPDRALWQSTFDGKPSVGVQGPLAWCQKHYDQLNHPPLPRHGYVYIGPPRIKVIKLTTPEGASYYCEPKDEKYFARTIATREEIEMTREAYFAIEATCDAEEAFSKEGA